jgi:hypothetical protein
MDKGRSHGYLGRASLKREAKNFALSGSPREMATSRSEGSRAPTTLLALREILVNAMERSVAFNADQVVEDAGHRKATGRRSGLLVDVLCYGSEVKLAGQLRSTAGLRVARLSAETGWIDSGERLAKSRVAEVTVRLREVSVVEDIVGLEANLEVLRLAVQMKVLIERHVAVVVAWAAEEISGRVAEGTRRFRRELRGVEPDVTQTGPGVVQFGMHSGPLRDIGAAVVGELVAI